VPGRRSTPLLALALVALAMAAAIAAPAAALAPSEQTEAARVTSWQPEAGSFPARLDVRAVGQPVLSPGFHWVPLPQPSPRMPGHASVAPGHARADLHTLSGWCLAHSTATAAP
jgi:hypothetical protein